MRGLTILGAGSEADAVLACAAACRAVRASGQRPAAFVPLVTGPGGDQKLALLAEAAEQDPKDLDAQVLGTSASPLVAARLEGLEIEPVGLLERAARAARGDVLVSALGGGLLAALTPRYTVRDFAREVGAPVVLAARAAPDVAAQVRLNAEAARSSGLEVAAVVLTDWPEPPGRVLIEERAALERVLGQAVQVVPGGRTVADLDAAVSGWPLERWLEPPGGAPEETPGEVTLEPYGAWEARQLGDPRTTPRPVIMAALLEIVAAEGPMTATRLYALHNRAAGGRKLTAAARAPLASAAYWLAQERRVVLTREADVPWQGDDLLRLPDAPAVRLRTLGPRTLDEVPLDEIAELIGRLRTARNMHDPTALKRAVLTAYGLLRLTARADEYLGLALDLAAD